MSLRPESPYGNHPPACTCVECARRRRSDTESRSGGSLENPGVIPRPRQASPSPAGRPPAKSTGPRWSRLFIAFAAVLVLSAAVFFYTVRVLGISSLTVAGYHITLPGESGSPFGTVAKATPEPALPPVPAVSQGERGVSSPGLSPPTLPPPDRRRPDTDESSGAFGAVNPQTDLALTSPAPTGQESANQASQQNSLSPGTPAPPPRWQERQMNSAGQIWSDRWVEFTLGPEICQNVLTVQGHTRDGATLGDPYSGVNEFVIYRKSALASRSRLGANDVLFSFNPPVLSFVAPAPSGTNYMGLPKDYQVARILRASRTNADFKLVSRIPNSIAKKPEDFALGLWGFRPGYGSDGIRLATLERCSDAP